MSFYYSKNFNSLSLAGGFFRYGAPQIKLLPIPALINNEYVLKLEDLTMLQITNNSKQNIKTIDEIVYHIYSLTPEEIKIVEES
jgi:hypothetical protein